MLLQNMLASLYPKTWHSQIFDINVENFAKKNIFKLSRKGKFNLPSNQLKGFYHLIS
jgi:hypothetical protein